MTQQKRIEQAAIEYCKMMNYILPNDKEYSLEAQTAIAAYTYALQNQWISVEDDLPENNVDVYYTCNGKYYGIGAYSKELKKWHVGEDEIYHVTHWMEIPKI